MLLPHRDLALGVVLRATGNLADAEDCVHDAMLRLARRDDLDPARVRALLVRAALHIAVDRRRAAGRQRTAMLRLAGGAAAEVTSPEELAAEHADAEHVRAALEELPRREREVILLRLAGLNVAETAGRLGISHKSVEGAYTRARARLRLLLGGALAWLLHRLRRSTPRGEVLAAAGAAMAMAATSAAALLAFPGAPPSQAAGGGGVALRPVSPSFPESRAAEPGIPPAGDDGHRTGSGRGPSGEADAGGPHTHIDLHVLAPDPPGFKKHNPPPGCDICVPIDAPFGLASTGVYVTGLGVSPQDEASGELADAQECFTHPVDPTNTDDFC